MSTPARFAAIAALAGLWMRASPDEIAKGLNAFERRDFSAAAQIFRSYLSQHPHDARVWKLLGMSYAAREDYRQAEPAFERACKENVREENACYYLARARYTLGQYAPAEQAYRIALSAAGQRNGRVLLGMALTLAALGKTVEAERRFRQAVLAGEPTARKEYGLFLFRAGRAEESLRLLREAGAAAELERVQKAIQAYGPESLARAAAPVAFQATALPMLVKNGATGEKHLIETMIAGVAVFDYDNDGWPDIFIANGATSPALQKTDSSFYNRLFRNNRDGAFQDVTMRAGLAGSGYSMGAAAGDFDNDGNIDLFVAGVAASALYRNRGDGSFEDVTAKSGLNEQGKWSVAAGWFDYDNDGLLDLFVVHYVVWDPGKEIFCGAPADAGGRTAFRQYCHPSYYEPQANALYHNLGNGRFEDVSVPSGIGALKGKGMGLTFGDYDGDGRLDVFVANDTTPNFLLHNGGGGRFHEVGGSAGVAWGPDGKALSSMGVEFRDIDNDGREDLFITALANETFPLFRNIGGMEFADITHPSRLGRSSIAWTGWSNAVADLNNDGTKDLAVAAGDVMDNAELSGRVTRQPLLVFLNKGGARFDTQTLSGIAQHRGLAYGDFDRDGRVDLVATRLNEAPVVLRNTTKAGNWIAFRLTGRTSNRDGVGAMIHIASARSAQWNRVITSTGYGCSSDPTVHFGLGGDTAVTSVDIAWPSGIRQRLGPLAANQLYSIEEPPR
ncbi:MAG TPA: FG-GAP-like repeat-containing protein [Bryobacteraceae bacterium]|nr:FG-GAP-like repeat-containing protein [Bryobacteraceae bacterium]